MCTRLTRISPSVSLFAAQGQATVWEWGVGRSTGTRTSLKTWAFTSPHFPQVHGLTGRSPSLRPAGTFRGRTDPSPPFSAGRDRAPGATGHAPGALRQQLSG